MKSLNKPAFTAPVLALVIFLFTLISGFVKTDPSAGAIELLLTVSVIQVTIFVLPSVFYTMLKKQNIGKTASLHFFTPARLILIIALLGVMLTGSLLINIAVYSMSGDASLLENSSSSLSNIGESAGTFITVVAVCIMPAICEEFAFRGVILGEYKVYGAVPAILASSLLFSMAHFSFPSFVSNLFCGIVLASAVLVTRSVYASMLLHAAYNLCTLFFVPYIRSILFEPLGTLFTVFFCAGLFFVFLAVSFREIQVTYHEYARRQQTEADAEFDKLRESGPSLSRGLLTVFVSISYILCIIVFILFTLIF